MQHFPRRFVLRGNTGVVGTPVKERPNTPPSYPLLQRGSYPYRVGMKGEPRISYRISLAICVWSLFAWSPYRLQDHPPMGGDEPPCSGWFP